MAGKPPATFNDLSDEVILLLFERIPTLKGRMALAHTCTRLRDLALRERAYASLEHKVISPYTSMQAVAHKVRFGG